jgi:hypothetical protein
MSNNNNTIIRFRAAYSLIIAYYPLFLVIIGTILNLLTFIILCQPTFNNKKKLPTIYYMRAIAIFDILMLYGWNLDHYISNVYGLLLQRYSIMLCKILSFLNYFSAQSSAWLRVFMCLDRYILLSHLHRTWFNRSKTVLITIICIITFFVLFNLHIIFFACFYTKHGTINVNARQYKIYPLWDYINLGLYNCVPFILMVIFNSGVIYHLIRHYRLSSIKISRIQYRTVSITLVLTTFLFLLMTIPATVSFAFFYSKASVTILHMLDSILYTYHILSFPLYLITFKEFRQECRAMLTYKNNRRTSSIHSRSLPFVIIKF